MLELIEVLSFFFSALVCLDLKFICAIMRRGRHFVKPFFSFWKLKKNVRMVSDIFI